jgi:hypothetical protein
MPATSRTSCCCCCWAEDSDSLLPALTRPGKVYVRMIAMSKVTICIFFVSGRTGVRRCEEVDALCLGCSRTCAVYACTWAQTEYRGYV